MKRYNELLTEISKQTLGSYVKKAANNGMIDAQASGGDYSKSAEEMLRRKKHLDKAVKRLKGIQKATDRLTKEDLDQMDEGSTEYPVMNARSPADKEFANAHPVDATDDANGNGDEVFKGTTSKDTSRKADKWTGDDDADDAESEEGLDTAGTFHAEDFDLTEGSMDKMSLDQLKKLHTHTHQNHDFVSDHGNKRGWQKLEAIERHVAKKYGEKHAREMIAHTDKLAESFELYELSKKVLGSYIKKAANEVGSHSGDHASLKMRSALQPDGSPYIARDSAAGDKSLAKAQKRLHGIRKATDKVVKEGEELQELSKKTLGSYIKKAGVSQVTKGLAMASHGAAGRYKEAGEEGRKAIKRNKGISRAVDKLAEEITEGEDFGGRRVGVAKRHGYHARENNTHVDRHGNKIQMGGSGEWTHINPSGIKTSGKGSDSLARHLQDMHHVNEDFPLQELSKATLGSYIKKARENAKRHDISARIHNSFASGLKDKDEMIKHSDKFSYHLGKEEQRKKGIKLARSKKLTKEELEQMDDDEFAAVCENFEQLDEISKKTLESYIKKAGAERDYLGSMASWKDDMIKGGNAMDVSNRKHKTRSIGIDRANKKLVKEDMREAAGTSFSVDNSDGGKKVHVTTGDTKHTVHRQRTMSSSHYVVHDHKSGNKKTFPYASDVADHLNDSGHEGVHSKHLSALY